MTNQKLESILAFSLTLSDNEKKKSQELTTGFLPTSNSWELIVKYHGSITQYQSDDIQIELLIAGYAIVTIVEPLIDYFSQLEEIEYIEKPMQLFFA